MTIFFSNIILIVKMRKRNEKVQATQFSILTPWEVQADDTPINHYCNHLIQANDYEPTVKTKKKIPNVSTKKRAISNCSNPKNENLPPAVEKNKYSKTQNEFMNQNLANKAMLTLTQNRTQRVEKRRENAERGVLQELKELSVKNFVIEGEQKSAVKQKGKKRESSYILKQKFNQFRRSMKSIAHFKENCNIKVLRYE